MGGAKSHTLLWLLVELNIVTFLDGVAAVIDHSRKYHNIL